MKKPKTTMKAKQKPIIVEKLNKTLADNTMKTNQAYQNTMKAEQKPKLKQHK
jgi:hypothetical protein